MSASSSCVTCGIVTQLRCRFAAESLRIRCSGWISVGPNFAKSISRRRGHGDARDRHARRGALLDHALHVAAHVVVRDARLRAGAGHERAGRRRARARARRTDGLACGRIAAPARLRRARARGRRARRADARRSAPARGSGAGAVRLRGLARRSGSARLRAAPARLRRLPAALRGSRGAASRRLRGRLVDLDASRSACPRSPCRRPRPSSPRPRRRPATGSPCVALSLSSTISDCSASTRWPGRDQHLDDVDVVEVADVGQHGPRCWSPIARHDLRRVAACSGSIPYFSIACATVAGGSSPSSASALQRRERDVVAIRPRRSGAAARACRSARSRRCRARRSGRGTNGADLVGVASSCSRSRRPPGPRAARRAAALDVALRARLGRVQQVPALAPQRPRARSSLKLVTLQTSAATPKSLRKQLRGREHLAQDRAAAEQLHARPRRPRASREQVHAAHDALARALGHRAACT